MSNTVQIVIALVVGLPMMLIVAWLASRLLGVRRSWVKTLVAGLVGYLIGAFAALAAAGWDLDQDGIIRNTFVLALIATMLTAIALDLLARPGSLPIGDAAGRFAVPHPVADLRQRLRPIGRYREIVGIARSNGLGRRSRSTTRPDEAPMGVRLRLTLEECGGMFVKLGQMASTRTDLLPPEITTELSKLQADAPPAPTADVKVLLEEELGSPVESVFAEFDWEPIAAASVAQAHVARLPNGDEVIVKVQRPRIRRIVDEDVQVVLQLARTIQDRTVYGTTLDLYGLAREFVTTLYDELDFTIEARNAVAIWQNIEKDPGAAALIDVPRVYPELSTERVLVQERLHGDELSDPAAFDGVDVDRHALADGLLETMLQQMMFDGFFHADPHPGNVFILDDGRLGLIDFGAAGLIDPITRNALREMVLSVMLRDARMLRLSVAAVTPISSNTDTAALERALAQFMAQHVQPGSGIDARAINDLAPLFSEYGITLPVGLTTFGRTLVTLEGTLSVLCPGYSISDGIQRAASTWAEEITDATTPEELVQQELISALPSLRKLPERLDDLSAQLTTGQYTTRVRLFADRHDEEVVTRLTNRIVLALIASVVLAVSAALVSVNAGPAFAGEATLLNVLGYVGLLGGSILLLRLVAQIIRDGLN